MSTTTTDLESEKNIDALKLAVSSLQRHLEKIQEGGGAKRLEKLHAEGKMSARERIDYLLDKGTPRIEIGAFAGHEMYAEHGGCPAGGVVVVIGYVRGRQCIVVANDATVKAGAWFPITGKKEPARPGNCPGKPPADHLPGGFGGGVPAFAGRDFPR